MTLDTSTLLVLAGQAIGAGTVIWKLGGRQARYEEKVDDTVRRVGIIETCIADKLVTQSECNARMAGGI